MPNTPIVNAGSRYVNGLTMTWVDATTIEISSGAARDSQNINDLILSDTVDLDLTLSKRVNGLNTGSLEATKAYKVYIVGDSFGYNATGVLAILDQGQIALPLGYDIYAQIGSFTTDGSSDVRKFYQYGRAASRFYYYDIPVNVLTNGSSTTDVVIPLTNIVPRESAAGDAKTVLYDCVCVFASGSDGFGLGTDGNAGNFLINPLSGTPTIYYSLNFIAQMTTDEIIAFDYLVNDASDSLTVNIAGYEDALI